MTTTAAQTGYDRAEIERALTTDGITALKGAFSPEWADRMREDIEAAFEEAIGREGGAVGRGPNRYYVEIHPEQLRGFLDIVSHPWFRTVCETVLGPDYKVLELGFDIPFAGAMNQPWHRDFPSPPETYEGRRLTSLAFNLTAVDTAEDMGPFEIALGTTGTIRCSRRRASTPASSRSPSASTRSAATSRPGRRSPCTAAPRTSRRCRGRCWSSASTRPARATTPSTTWR
jgi:hypothetical protein